MPTLQVDPAEVRTLQSAIQKANADLPGLANLASLTAKVAALSDEPVVVPVAAPATK